MMPNTMTSNFTGLGPGTTAATEDCCSRSEASSLGSRSTGQAPANVVNRNSSDRSSSRRLFPDVDAMKERVRMQLLRPQYDVLELYHEHGVFQQSARHKLFEAVTLVVIGLNALWIAIDTDWNDANVLVEAHPVFQVAEHFFCAYFSCELFVRYMAFSRKRDALMDAWFVFDSILVVFMILETWVMTAIILASGGSSNPLGEAAILKLLRLLRLSRMARMARLMRAIPDVMILMKGMMQATRSVGFVAILLLVIMYVFGIVFRQLAKGTEMGAVHFPSVPHAMYTLWIAGTLMDDIGATANDISNESHICWAVFFAFVGISAITVMNMLIGVICEVISHVAAEEKEIMTVAFVKERMQKIMSKLDTTNDGLISKAEFVKILDSTEAICMLTDVDVDVVGLVDLADFIFNDESSDTEKKLDFEDFMDLVLQIRGTNPATVRDMFDLRKYVVSQNERTHSILAEMEKRLVDDRNRSSARALTQVSATSTGPSHALCAGGEHPTCPQPQTTDTPSQVVQVGSHSPCYVSGVSSNSDGLGNSLDPGFFPSAEAMKDKVRASIMKSTYDVSTFYHSYGLAQKIARHKFFEISTLTVIALNALWISIETDWNDAAILTQAHPLIQVIEHLFCAYFSFEWFVRFFAFKRKRDGLGDGWFVFDSLLVSTMVLETWVMTAVIVASGSDSNPFGNAAVLRLLRLLRLSRMSRMVRLLRAFPELLVLIKGIFAAMRAVGVVALVLILIMYVFGIILRQLSDGTDMGEEFFKSVPHAMVTLLIYGTLLDNVGDTAGAISDESWVCWVIFFVFLVISALTLMNMLIGVLCEMVTSVSEAENEAMTAQFMREKMHDIMYSIDLNCDGNISKQEFVRIVSNEDAVQVLQDVDVDPVSLVDLADFIFNDLVTGTERKLTFADFMEIVFQIRGGNAATVKDVVDFRKFARLQSVQTQTKLAQLEQRLVCEFEGVFDKVCHSEASTMQVRRGDESPRVSAAHTPPLRIDAERSSPRCPRGAGIDAERVGEWVTSLEDSLGARWDELQKMVLSLPSADGDARSLLLSPKIGTGSRNLGIFIGEQASLPGAPPEEISQPVSSDNSLVGVSGPRSDLREGMTKLLEALAVGLGEAKRARERLPSYLESSVPTTRSRSQGMQHPLGSLQFGRNSSEVKRVAPTDEIGPSSKAVKKDSLLT